MQSVVIFSNLGSGQKYGLAQDAKFLDLTFRELNATGKTNIKITHKDPITYVGKGSTAEKADIHIYLEVPCRAAFPWAKVNIIIPNQEWWFKDAWSWVLQEKSAVFLYKTRYCQTLFEQMGAKGYYIGWRGLAGVKENTSPKKSQFLYIVGGSKYKRAAADIVVNAWSPDFPPLIVVATEAGLKKAGVSWRTGYISETEKQTLINESRYHVVASFAEGLGYTVMEAIGADAQVLWNDIPAYRERWGSQIGITGCIETTSFTDISGCLDKLSLFSEAGVIAAVNNLLTSNCGLKNGPNSFVKITKDFRNDFFSAWRTITKKLLPQIAPPKPIENLPVLGIVTLVHNRPEWFSHAVKNIEITDYPRDKFVWVIVDDSDFNLRVDSAIEKVRTGYPDLNIQYVSLPKKTPIGEKRNRGCATALMIRQDLLVFASMDDDDHYPASSLRLRAAWLLSSGRGAVYCSTLPMYDICKYISAINVPPLYLAASERVSEATLCFTKDFWKAKGFPKTVNVAEGEGFILGRESETIEIPPEGVIVSFLHKKNLTSRRVPESKEPNGCHYGFSDEYFEMISKIGGIIG
jgi:hypothetical protein